MTSMVEDRRPIASWPGGARMAVAITFAFEAWEGKTVSSGYFSPFPADLLDRGVRDHLTHSWGDYGGRTGIWRLLRVMRAEGVKGTCLANTLAMQRFPEAARTVVQEGHELAGHSRAQDLQLARLSRDEQRQVIRDSVLVSKELTGKRVIGWMGPAARGSDDSLALLIDEGFLWHADCADADLPYLMRLESGEIVAIPYTSFDINDMNIYLGGRHAPDEYIKLFKNSFDVQYAESESGPSLIQATMHAHLFGRPFGAYALQAIVRYARSHSGVWFATRREIAEWWSSRRRAET